MSSPAIFTNGNNLVVDTLGPGNLHLLSYNNPFVPNVVGITPTNHTDESRFLISHSYYFENYAFFWDGKGEAVYGLGTGLERLPVGTSWTSASLVAWGSGDVTTGDVSSQISSATVVNNEITAFVIPDEI